MNDMERTLTVAVLIGMLVMIFVLSGKTNDLEDRVKQLEQVEEVKEIVSRGHGTGIGIGGSSRTFIDERIAIDIGMNMSHFSEPLPRRNNPIQN